MISTHILDLNLGNPAEGVVVLLEKKSENHWVVVHEAKTNNDGRIAYDVKPEAGTYRLTFQIQAYFEKMNIEPFFVVAPVEFRIIDSKRKYHVPLLLSPYGYSTYRGS